MWKINRVRVRDYFLTSHSIFYGRVGQIAILRLCPNHKAVRVRVRIRVRVGDALSKTSQPRP